MSFICTACITNKLFRQSGAQVNFFIQEGRHPLVYWPSSMATRTTELKEELNTLEIRTEKIETALINITELLTKSARFPETKEEPAEEDSISLISPELQDVVTPLSVMKHILANSHSQNLKQRDRFELDLLLRLHKYEEHFTLEDRSLLLARLQHYVVVVTAGWTTTVNTSKRTQIEVCGVTVQAGDFAQPNTKRNYYKKRGGGNQNKKN